MAIRMLGLALVCLFLVTGCCPRGVTVLGSLTLAEDELDDGCRLKQAHSVEGVPTSVMRTNPLVTSGAEAAAAIGENILSPFAENTKNAYAAAYECAGGGSEILVCAVIFDEPTGAERAARLVESPNGVLFKGQLAAVVLTDGDECAECYGKVRARVERVLAR